MVEKIPTIIAREKNKIIKVAEKIHKVISENKLSYFEILAILDMIKLDIEAIRLLEIKKELEKKEEK